MPTFSSKAVPSSCGGLKSGLGTTGARGAPTEPAVGTSPAGWSEAGAASQGRCGSLQHPEGAAPHSDRQGQPGIVGVLPAGAETRRVTGRSGAGEHAQSGGKEMKRSVLQWWCFYSKKIYKSLTLFLFIRLLAECRAAETAARGSGHPAGRFSVAAQCAGCQDWGTFELKYILKAYLQDGLFLFYILRTYLPLLCKCHISVFVSRCEIQ